MLFYLIKDILFSIYESFQFPDISIYHLLTWDLSYCANLYLQKLISISNSAILSFLLSKNCPLIFLSEIRLVHKSNLDFFSVLYLHISFSSLTATAFLCTSACMTEANDSHWLYDLVVYCAKQCL